MNFLDQIAKQPLAVKIGVLIVALVAMFIIEWQVFLAPKKVEIKNLEKKKEDLKLKLVENEAIAANLGKFEDEVNILNEQLKQAIALLPNEADVHSLYRQLSIAAKKTNINLLTFRPAGQSSHGFYNDLSMDLKLHGSYNDIAIFIDQVGKLSRIVNISNIVFSSPTLVGNTINMNVDCRATTFMFSGGRS